MLHAGRGRLGQLVAHQRDDGHVGLDHLVDLLIGGDALLVVGDGTRRVDGGVDVRVAVVEAVIEIARLEELLDDVVGRGIGSLPAEAADLVVLGVPSVVERAPVHHVELAVDADLLEAGLDGLHDRLVVAVAVEGELELDAALAVGVRGIVLVEQLLGRVGVVVRVLPGVLLVARHGLGQDVVGRHAGALVDGLADGLTVDGQRDGATQVDVLQHGVGVDHGQEVDARHVAECQALVVVAQRVAVLGLLHLAARGLDGRDRHVADVDVAALELAVAGLHVLLDGEGHAGDQGLVALVVLEAQQVDRLPVFPLAVHHEGAVADRGPAVRRRVVERRLGHRRGARDGGDQREVAEGDGELHDQRVVVGAGHAGQLLGVAALHRVVALDHLVVGRLHGGVVVGRRVAHALPAALERLRVHGVAIVEGVALGDVEGELGRVVVGLPALGGQRGQLFLLVVVVGEVVKELLGHDVAGDVGVVVGIDAGRVGQVVGQAGTRRGCRAVPRRGLLPAASGDLRRDACGQRARLQKRATRDVAGAMRIHNLVAFVPHRFSSPHLDVYKRGIYSSSTEQI